MKIRVTKWKPSTLLILAWLSACDASGGSSQSLARSAAAVEVTPSAHPAFPITFDLRALSLDAFGIYDTADVGELSSHTLQSVQLAPGMYIIQLYSSMMSDVAFTVKEDGTLDYDDRLSQAVSGKGTSTLTVSGFPIDFDARQLSMTGLQPLLFGNPAVLDTSEVQHLRLMPAPGYGFVAGSGQIPGFGFGVDLDGNPIVSADEAGFTSVVDKTVILSGYPVDVTVHTRGGGWLEANLFGLVGGVQPADQVVHLRLLPLWVGAYSFYDAVWGAIPFAWNLGMDGKVQFDSTYNGIASGRGTTTLTVNQLTAPGDACENGSQCETGFCASGSCATFPQLVGRWALTEQSGTVAADSSGKGENGTLVGGPTWSNENALVLGPTQSVRVAGASALETPQVQVELWVKIGLPNQAGGTFASYGHADDTAPAWALRGGPAGVDFVVGGLDAHTEWARIADFKYHQITGSFDGKVARLSIDGVAVASASASTPFAIAHGAAGTNVLFLNSELGRPSSGASLALSDVQVYSAAVAPQALPDGLPAPHPYRTTQPEGCPWAPPVTHDSRDVTNDWADLAGVHPFGLKIHNLYWSDDWNRDSPSIHKDTIDRATRQMIDTGYFKKACQYGVPNVTWEGSNDTSGWWHVCTANPGDWVPDPAVYDFVGCEESMIYTNLVKGIPGPSCALCGLVPGDKCWQDAACFSVPNPSGDTIINVFIPPGSTLAASNHCTSFSAYHLQLPSNDIGSGFLGGLFALHGTGGIPLYVAIIPLECADGDINRLMEMVSHEDIEAATDYSPGAQWFNHDIGFAHGEVADLCEDEPQTYHPACESSNEMTLRFNPYWSNSTHSCVMMDEPHKNTCASTNTECGPIPDGCGGTIDCGSCGPGSGCGQDGVCVPMTDCRRECNDQKDSCLDTDLPASTCISDWHKCLNHCSAH